jgi:8-oxo-dGTP diphosphatase
MINGAGVILWREQLPLSLEVAIIHRPKYDDWTFPKGGVEIGENSIQAAFRECQEETGMAPILGPYIGAVTYQEEGKKKSVEYWMGKEKSTKDSFQVNAEVDQIQWMSAKEARHFLTYDSDREILARFMKLERHVSTLVFLRHAKAVKREDWLGEDSDRPLAHIGQLQASKLSALFRPFGIEQIHSSDAQRCLATAQPIAEGLRIESSLTPKLSEDVFEKNDTVAIEYIEQLLKFNMNTIVCSHNPMFNEMLLAFENARDFFKHLPKLSPADSWIVHHSGNRIIAIDALPAPIVERG